jgi:hypothetical protein
MFDKCRCQQFKCCPLGTELNTSSGECVATSCAANPCKATQTCKSTTNICKTGPCPQFQCVDKPTPTTCGVGQAYDDVAQACVAVSCDAPSACKLGSVCQKTDVQCVRAPCPQFTCIEPPRCAVGEQLDNLTQKCVPVSCEAEAACDSNSKCVPNTGIKCIRSPCPQFQCEPLNNGCGVGEELDALTKQCVAVSCDAKPCKLGSVCQKRDVQCIRAPCPQFECVSSSPTCGEGEAFDSLTKQCVAVSCEAKPCDEGSVCQKADIQCIRAPCPQFQCIAPTKCAVGEEYSKLEAKCVPVSCDAASACPSPKQPYCTPSRKLCLVQPCQNFVCSAEPETCGVGEAFDELTKQCVAVSCDAKPCKEGSECRKVDLQCIRAPCPQFQCVASASCGVGEERNSAGVCVAVSCEAKSACTDAKLPRCVATPGIVCKTGPCPQFACVEASDVQCGVGEEFDRLSQKCVAVSCKANPCPKEKPVCSEKDALVCVRAPCPRFTCSADEPNKCPEFEEFDSVTNKCVAVACGSANACPADKPVCTPSKKVCLRAPCQQFTCAAKPVSELQCFTIDVVCFVADTILLLCR